MSHHNKTQTLCECGQNSVEEGHCVRDTKRTEFLPCGPCTLLLWRGRGQGYPSCFDCARKCEWVGCSSNTRTDHSIENNSHIPLYPCWCFCMRQLLQLSPCSTLLPSSRLQTYPFYTTPVNVDKSVWMVRIGLRLFYISPFCSPQTARGTHWLGLDPKWASGSLRKTYKNVLWNAVRCVGLCFCDC